MSAAANPRVAVFNLPSDIRESQVEDLFHRFGRIRDMIIRSNSGNTFAFIEFDSTRDAEDALDRRNDYPFAGRRLRVEFSRDRPRGGGGHDSHPGAPPSSAMRDAYYRVRVSGLPKSSSWQDLKDFMRSVGDVRFTDIIDEVGIAGFASQRDMDRAIRELDDTKFRSRTGESAYVRVKEDRGSKGSRSRSRSRSRGKDDRSRSRSHKKSRSRSRSRH